MMSNCNFLLYFLTFIKLTLLSKSIENIYKNPLKIQIKIFRSLSNFDHRNSKSFLKN